MPGVRRNIILFNDTSRSKHFGCKLVMRELLSLMQVRGLEPSYALRVGRDWRRRADRVAALSNLSAVIVNGEGTIHHTASRPGARRLLELARFAHDRLGVPAFLVNATLHDIAPEDGPRLREFDGIFVRESRSLDAVENLGSFATVVPDLTLHAVLPRGVSARQGVCGTDNVVQSLGVRLRQLCRQNGWPFWPMHYSLRNLRRQPPSVDRFLPDYILVCLRTKDYASALAGFLTSHRLLVTGRYHAVTYAMLTRTPFLAVESNTPKISSLVADALGNTRRVIDPDDLLRTDLEQYASWEGGELASLDRFCAHARSSAERMMDDIAARIGGAS
jgi:hypothetical protein